jgi:hypothetical protein
MAIQIYSEFSSSRLLFVLDSIFTQILGKSFVLHLNLNDYLNQSGPSILYGTNSTGKVGEILIPNSGFLLENITIPTPEIHYIEGLPTGFKIEPIHGLNSWKFDFFAFTFWHLSRWEEYEEFEPDSHQRFSAKSSHAFKNGYLDVPFIDCWAFELAKTLGIKEKTQIITPTFDVDMAFAYLHKNWVQTIGGFGKDLIRKNKAGIVLRWQTLTKKRKDPFDTFNFLIDLATPFPNSHFFFLVGGKSYYDRNLSPKHPAMIKLINTIQNEFNIGIHPSYQSNLSKDLLFKEIQILSKITNQSITKSRQHYLKIKFPHTYRCLIEVGIKEDFSMGYADAIGFRLGTSFPVYWYDLEKEETTSLLLIPFAVMDVTFKKYLELSPEESCFRIKSLKNNAYQLNFVWHNSNLSKIDNWENWDLVLKELIGR